jgi:hypothetical protein
MARKLFPCGHKGKGQYCHVCAHLHNQNVVNKAHEEEIKMAKLERRARILAAPVPLICLPIYVQDEALDLFEAIKTGTPCHNIPHAKRLAKSGQRDVISIKIGWGHRLVCREQPSGEVLPEWVGSHESYNKRYSKTVR